MNYNKLTLIKCSLNNIDDILNLQNNIFDNLLERDWLRENSKDMFVRCTKYPNITFGLYDSDTLIAIIIMYAENDDEKLSNSLINHTVINSANYKVVMVRNGYRGFKLSKVLMWILERHAFYNNFTHLCATANEHNVYSVNNLIDSGYVFDSSCIKYGSLKRSLFVKDIRESQFNFINNISQASIKSVDKCFAGNKDVCIYGDYIEYNGKYGIVNIDNNIIFEDDSICPLNDLSNYKVWINTNLD